MLLRWDLMAAMLAGVVVAGAAFDFIDGKFGGGIALLTVAVLLRIVAERL